MSSSTCSLPVRKQRDPSHFPETLPLLQHLHCTPQRPHIGWKVHLLLADPHNTGHQIKVASCMATNPCAVWTLVECLTSQLRCHLELGQIYRLRAPFCNTLPFLQMLAVGSGSPGCPYSCTTLPTMGSSYCCSQIGGFSMVAQRTQGNTSAGLLYNIRHGEEYR